MTKLRLGRIEDDKPVKITIELTGATYREIGRYAQAHAEETELEQALPIERLVPAMLERFMAGDRAFLRRRKRPT